MKIIQQYDPIFDSKKILKKIMRIVTDTADINDSKDKDTPFQLYSLFLFSRKRICQKKI